MQVLAIQKPMLPGVMMAASLVFVIVGVATSAQDSEKASPMVVRVAVFSADQERPDNYREFIEGHLFPTVRTVPGYVGTFIGRDQNVGGLISVSFWRNEADAVSGEEAVSRVIRALPPGSAPRPSKVDKYVIVYRDLKEPMGDHELRTLPK